jgi:hypothetical protein
MNNKIHCISYASNHFIPRSTTFLNEANSFNLFSSIDIHSPDTITQSFKENYKDILKMPRGGGYWLWKLDILTQKFNSISTGDIVFYLDVGCTINNTPKSMRRFWEYIDIINDNSFLRFQLTHPEICYTNSTALQFFAKKYKINLDDISNTNQFSATIFGMKKDNTSLNFLNELTNIIKENPHLITDEYNLICKNDKFIDHRHDQSLLSLLHKCLNLKYSMQDETYSLDWSELSHVPFLATRKRS